MSSSLALLLTAPAAILLTLACLPNSLVNARPLATRNAVTWIAAFQFFVAVCISVILATGRVRAQNADLLRFSSDTPFAVSIYFDGVASLMLMLVSFLGWVICQYSLRYLDGEATQGSYFRWTGLTIGSVCLMVVAGNLLMFIVAWVTTSLGLHQLLLHYGQRPAARRAAWTKFTTSRIGDAALIVAAVLIYAQFRTLEFVELFALVGSLTTVTVEMQVAGFLLVLGVITKSAQFPFHTWLPQTMETPTPVSALMHAGIVNAGGYLMIRTSSVVALTPWALTTLAIIAGFTAFFAAVVMLTQSSVKKSLAYSTIAQMGFMLLQCALGAYSAAMLHILAHSLYKAHAFLSSGSVIAARAAITGSLSSTHQVNWFRFVASGVALIAVLWASLALFRSNPVTKPGGLLLGGILCLALHQWIGQVMRGGHQIQWLRALAVAGGLCLLYSASFATIDSIISASLPVAGVPQMLWLVASFVATGFLGLLVLQAALVSGRESAILNRYYIHASNGFYLESTLRRVFGSLLNT
ncbi:MAG: oxidoreductase [Pirellulaceae bacterium]|nr:oxidoreductase [Pirellulaceae bacterium]